MLSDLMTLISVHGRGIITTLYHCYVKHQCLDMLEINLSFPAASSIIASAVEPFRVSSGIREHRSPEQTGQR